MKAMILAAGLGTRLRPLTDHCPKPMLVVGGKPLLQHHLEHLAAAGIRDVVINISWLGEQVVAFFGNGSALGLNIVYSREHEPLETGGGIFNALPLLGEEPFLLVNGDVWSDISLVSLVHKPLAANRLAHLVLVDNPAHNRGGDFLLDGQGNVVANDSIITNGSFAGKKLTYSGISVLAPDLFSHCGHRRGDTFPLREVLLPAISAGRVTGEQLVGKWIDVGTQERLHMLEQLLATD